MYGKSATGRLRISATPPTTNTAIKNKSEDRRRWTPTGKVHRGAPIPRPSRLLAGNFPRRNHQIARPEIIGDDFGFVLILQADAHLMFLSSTFFGREKK